MQNKKLIVGLSLLVVLVGGAAFLGGRLLNQRVGPMGLSLPLGGGDQMMSVAIEIVPAPELPTTEPQVTGLFSERKDNTILVQSVSMEAGRGGVVIQSSGGDEDGGVEFSPGNSAESGPKVEVVISADTTIYLETTPFPEPSADAENQVVQQTVGEGSLDDLTSQSFVTVWGRKSGDRIIAEVIFISNPVMFKRP